MFGLFLGNQSNQFISEIVLMTDEVDTSTQAGQLAVRSRG